MCLFLIDMQHDRILKKLNFGLSLTPSTHLGDRTQAFELKYRLICFMSIVPLSVCEISVKILTTDLVIAKFKYLTFNPA